MKLKTVIIAIILASILFGAFKAMADKIKKQKAEITRIEANNIQLLQENIQYANYILRDNEVIGKLRHEKDSIAEALRIKPKQIEKIKYETITVHDSIDRPVPVYIAGKNFWQISDTINKCTVYKADIFLTDDSLTVKRTDFFNQNKVTNVHFRQRPHRFLFIRWGKWVNLQQTSSECGEIKTVQFEFIK